MQIPNKFNQFSSPADLTQTLTAATASLAEQLNCMRIGIVQEFFPDNLTAMVTIANKKLIGFNPNGSQILKDYPPIYAKVCYCCPFATFPLTKGMECILLFNDREIESWFINGDVNPQSYPRMHDLTDAVAIVGIRSIPQMIQIVTDCLNLFYGSSSLMLKDSEAGLNSTTLNLTGETVNINGNLIINGKPYTQHQHSNGNQGSPTGGIVQ